jgi:lipoate-protein ligase A
MNPSASEPWLLLESGPGDPAYNMALDEVLLAEATRIGHPLLRFYGWTQPAATFGYAQRWDEVAALTELRPLIRRPTGGGLVLHDGEWTYSVVLPPGHDWTRLRARESYHRVHDWVRESLTRLGIKARLAPPTPPAVPGACFARAEESDVLDGSQKIAGAAQRRNRQGLLIQGSVRPPGTAPNRAHFESAMRTVAAERWGSVWQVLTDAAPLCRQAAVLAVGKFACASHNQRR